MYSLVMTHFIDFVFFENILNLSLREPIGSWQSSVYFSLQHVMSLRANLFAWQSPAVTDKKVYRLL